MKKYFFYDGKEKHGPLSLEELKHEDISKESLIWFEGLDDWKPAGTLDEMKPILELQPPSIPTLSFSNRKMRFEITESDDKNERGTKPIRKGMFSRPFSFDGRIRRTEYFISFIIVTIALTFVNSYVELRGEENTIFIKIPIYWFLFAQAAKRLHDLGYSGWWQLIPFSYFWLLFVKGESKKNKYGQNPKG